MTTPSQESPPLPVSPRPIDPPPAGERRNTTARIVLEGASVVASHLSGGLRKASDMLAAPASTDVDGMLNNAELPGVAADDPLVALTARLDRESAFWRSLALRAMGRAAWVDRIAHVVSVLTAVAIAAVAAVGAFDSIFSAGSGGAKAVLIGVASLALAMGGAIVVMASVVTRRGQREVVQDAMKRTDIAESRLHRLAVLLALRSQDAPAFRAAVERLERDLAGVQGARE